MSSTCCWRWRCCAGRRSGSSIGSDAPGAAGRSDRMAYIRVANVSVDIPIYDVGGASLRKRLLGHIGGSFAASGWYVIVNALKDISFEAHDGDRVGLIGGNGAGKTTLLRVLSEVYPPMRGEVEVHGRVSPMLDA